MDFVAFKLHHWLQLLLQLYLLCSLDVAKLSKLCINDDDIPLGMTMTDIQLTIE